MSRATMEDYFDLEDLLAPGVNVQRVNAAVERIKQRALDEANAPEPFE